MIKINNECLSKCLLLCLEQTELKYGEALVRSDGLTKHSVLVRWKILEMKKICPFSVKSSVTNFSLILASECYNRVLGLFPTQFCDAVMCLVVTVLDLPPLPPKQNLTNLFLSFFFSCLK